MNQPPTVATSLTKSDLLNNGLVHFLDTVFMVFVGLSVLLYVVCVVCMIKYRRELNSSFFIICISTGISDIYYIVLKNCTRQIPRILFYDYFRPSTLLATVSSAGGWYGFYCSIIGMFLLSVNRLTALCFPDLHKRIWGKNVLLGAMLAFQWLAPLIFPVPMLLYAEFGAAYDDAINPRFINEKVYRAYWTFNMVCQVLVMMPTFIIMYAYMFYKAAKFHKQMAAVSKKDEERIVRKLELRLAFVGGSMSVIYILLCTTYISFALQIKSTFFSLAFFYLTDLFFAANPWLLLIGSKKLRYCLYCLMTCTPFNESSE